MTTPSTSIYARPGLNSHTWNYHGATFAGQAITSVAFVLSGEQQVGRGEFQYSRDGGMSWTSYALGTAGSDLPAAGTLWRFVDRMSGDTTSPGSFTMQFRLADNSVVRSDAYVLPDNAPFRVLDDSDFVFSNLAAGATVASLTAGDTGAPTGGRWVIDSQSHAGLFSVSADPLNGSARLVVANAAAMPAVDTPVAVTVHYYDRYQLDAYGNPIAGQGVAETLVYNVVPGTSSDLPRFGPDLSLGKAAGAQAGPALARLPDGGFAAVWQGEGDAIWAQVRDAAGNARGAAFALTAGSDARTEGEPTVGALAGGRYVVAYTAQEGAGSRIAWRIMDASGATGVEMTAGQAADASMPAVATLADGSFVLAWRSGGTVHAQRVSGSGSPMGGEQVFSALGTAYSPAVAALANGGYAVAWGEMGDANIYLAFDSKPAAVAVTDDGSAASISTAAPLPHITALAGGGLVVAWDSYRNDPYGFSMSDIFFQRYDSGGNRVGELTQANFDGGGGRFDANVAGLSDGGFVIGWQARSGDYHGTGVFGRRFGADGVARDEREFGINQMREGDQASPDIAALDNGGFAVVWVDSQHGMAAIEARVLAGEAPVAPAGTGAAGGTVGTPAGTGTTSSTSGTASGSGGTTSGSGTTTPNPAPALKLVQGKEGLDQVQYGAPRAHFKIAKSDTGFTVSSGDQVNDKLVHVERIQFSDTWVALDVDGVAGKAYRLYQAAFDRAPDKAGLGYWIKGMDSGAALYDVASFFMQSKEFADLYGANASNTRFVELLYANVLHRTPDSAGYQFWLGAMEQSGLERASMLTMFSESVENQAQVIGSIQDGMLFDPWIG